MLPKLFISYSHTDIELRKKLVDDLKSHGIEEQQIMYDRDDLGTISDGNLWLKQISDALGTSTFFLAIMTNSYVKSKICEAEYYSQLGRVLTKENQKRFIQLFFEPLDSLNLGAIPEGIQGISMHEHNYEVGLRKLISDLNESRADSHEVFKRTFAPSSLNPFNKVKAEEIGSDIFMKLFHAPASESYDQLKGQGPVIIEGGRGSGKTMSLKSLELAPQIRSHGSGLFRDKHANYFGIYWKASRGAVLYSSHQAASVLTEGMLVRIFTDDFNFRMVELLIKQLMYCNSNQVVEIDGDCEIEICRIIATELFPDKSATNYTFTRFLPVISSCRKELKAYADRQLINKKEEYQEGIFRSGVESLERIYEGVRGLIPELRDIHLFILVDEYENLLQCQQKTLNTIIKNRGNVVLKVSSKIDGYTTETLSDQPLQPFHDYSPIELDYNLANYNEWNRYKELILGITRNALVLGNFAELDIFKILDGNPELVTEEELQDELELLIKSRKWREEITLEKRKTLLQRYRKTLKYKALAKKRKNIPYSGLDCMLYLSAGITRYFLELCSMMFYITPQISQQTTTIPQEYQTEAAETVSTVYFDRIAKSIGDDGPKLQRIILDIGRVFRLRLLDDLVEPETISISITDPEHLDQYKDLERILKLAVKESVLQKEKTGLATKPKNPSKPLPEKYVLHRVYAPALAIDYTDRWRTDITCDDLNGLLDSKTRSKSLANIVANTRKQIDERFAASGTMKLENFDAENFE